MGNNLGKVHGNAANFHTDALPLVLDLRDQLRRVQQTLGWNAAYVQAGAGVVYDSIPENEFYETINKAKAMTRIGDVQ